MDDTITARLWEIVQVLADQDCTYYDGYDDKKCVFCDGEGDFDGNFAHDETCLKVKAWQAIVDRNTPVHEGRSSGAMERISVGDVARVLAPGQFHGQVVKVLNKKVRKHDIDYQLETNWDGKPYPGWFGHDEIEKVSDQQKGLSSDG